MSSSTQSCSVPQYTVMVTSATSTDMSAVNVSYCTSSSCSYVQSISGANFSSYNVSVACRNTRNQIRQPYVTYVQSKYNTMMNTIHHKYIPYMKALYRSHVFLGSFNNVIRNASLLSYYGSMAMAECSFFYCQCYYCVVCCSTDPSVPPDSSAYNISTTKSTEVTVSLQGLTSGQMYYCKAAATNTNSNNCAGQVVGGVKVFFSFMASPLPQPNILNHGRCVHMC